VIDILLNALVPIFAVMGLGYFAGWIRDVDNSDVSELNALVMDFALPAGSSWRWRQLPARSCFRNGRSL
jgi:predicted permease